MNDKIKTASEPPLDWRVGRLVAVLAGTRLQYQEWVNANPGVRAIFCDMYQSHAGFEFYEVVEVGTFGLRPDAEAIRKRVALRQTPNDLLGVFVTAKLAGLGDCRQGAVISTDPLRIRGQSGEEYDCEGCPTVVVNPPEKCIGCDLPLGRICGRCATNLRALGKALDDAGIVLTPNNQS